MESLEHYINKNDVLMSAFWFGGCLVLFSLLARISPNICGQKWWRKDVSTDAIYWFFMPLIYSKILQLMIAIGLIAIFAGNQDAIRVAAVEGFGPLKDLSLWLQVGMALLIQDIMMYWMHRWFHEHRMWKYHAIHHSSEELDWLSTSRFHPVNLLLYSTLTLAVVYVMGFNPLIFVILTPFNIMFSAMVHANLNWTFGPLRYVISSPVFHRWHHTSPEEGGNMNFAPTFPFIDLMFGTFYMPKGKMPEKFGVSEPVPRDFLGQLRYPFERRDGGTTNS